MKKRIGNDIQFTWHIYRKSGEEQVPESFTGKEVEVKLISPLQRPVTIEDVTIATGVVTFTFRGKHQVTLGNYVAVLQENRGEDGMVTLDVVDAVTLVPHSYMEEDGDEGDVIEAESVDLTSTINAGGGGGIEQQQADWAQTDDTAVDYIKNKPNLGLYVPRNDDDGHGNMSIYSPGNIVLTLANEQGVVNQTGSFWAGGWSVSSPDGRFQTFGNSIYRGTMGLDHDSVVWEKTATQQIPSATTEENGLMSAEDKSKLNELPTATELAQELGGKANSADLAEVATSGSYNDLSSKPDLSGFITNSVDNLLNYYLKSETYTKTEVQQLIGAIQQFHYEVYPTLPQTGASNVLYLIGPTGSGSDKYEEYVYANNDWTKIGDTSIDLSGYVTTGALTTALADYVTSSALSATLASYVNKNDVDDVPTPNSDNPVKSGGVMDADNNLLNDYSKQIRSEGEEIEATIITGYYFNTSGSLTKNSSCSCKYVHANKGDVVFIRTAIEALYGGVGLFTDIPTTTSTATLTYRKNKIYLLIPFDCYILVSHQNSALSKIGVYNTVITSIPIIDTVLYDEQRISSITNTLATWKNNDGQLDGYINSTGVNGIKGAPWKILYIRVSAGTIIDSNGSVSGNYRAGFTYSEPVSGFALDYIIATDTTFPYVAEKSGWFCISQSISNLYLKAKTYIYPNINIPEQIEQLNKDAFCADEPISALSIYDNYYITRVGSWGSLTSQRTIIYQVTPGDILYINSNLNTNYMFVGWNVNLPQPGTNIENPIPYTDGIDRCVKVPDSINYMVITGYVGGGEKLEAYSTRKCNSGIFSLMNPDTTREINAEKTAIYVGDSISTGYRWREFIRDDYGLSFQENITTMPVSVKGITLIPRETEMEGHESIWWRCAEQRIINAGYTPTIISVFGGTNDMVNSSMNIGTINDIPFVDDSSDFSVETTDASNGWPETLSFCSALKGCILMLRRDFPNAQIIIPTVLYCGTGNYGGWIPSGETLAASEIIAKRQVQIAQIYSLRFVPWYWSERNANTLNIFSVDNVHPSIAGARVMARWFADYMPL